MCISGHSCLFSSPPGHHCKPNRVRLLAQPSSHSCCHEMSGKWAGWRVFRWTLISSHCLQNQAQHWSCFLADHGCWGLVMGWDKDLDALSDNPLARVEPNLDWSEPQQNRGVENSTCCSCWCMGRWNRGRSDKVESGWETWGGAALPASSTQVLTCLRHSQHQPAEYLARNSWLVYFN